MLSRATQRFSHSIRPLRHILGHHAQRENTHNMAHHSRALQDALGGVLPELGAMSGWSPPHLRELLRQNLSKLARRHFLASPDPVVKICGSCIFSGIAKKFELAPIHVYTLPPTVVEATFLLGRRGTRCEAEKRRRSPLSCPSMQGPNLCPRHRPYPA